MLCWFGLRSWQLLIPWNCTHKQEVKIHILFISLPRLAKTADKVLGAADSAYKTLDEERGYILYMRYVFCWKIIRQSSEYKKDSVCIEKS